MTLFRDELPYLAYFVNLINKTEKGKVERKKSPLRHRINSCCFMETVPNGLRHR